MPQTTPFRCPQARAAIFALAIGLSLAGCTGNDAASLIADARQQSARGDLKAAIIQLKNALQQDGQNASARLLLGEAYLEIGDAVSAEKELRRAGELGERGATLPLLLGKAMLLQGHFDQLLAEIGPVAPAAQRPAMHALRANALLGLGKVKEATAMFDAALKLHPDQPQALLGLARIASGNGKVADAGTLIRRALAANPAELDCLRFQADLLRADGQAEAALASHAKILALRPNNAQAHLDVANIHIDASRFAQAQAAIDAARKAGGATVGVVYAQGLIAFRENKLTAALESLQQVLRVAPEHYPAILLAGAVQSALGAPEQAGMHLGKFLATYPGHVYASKLMSMLHTSANKPDAALALLRPLLLEHPDDVELLTLAGEAHLNARRFSAAADFLERANALRPDTPALRTALALSRLGTGENARAVAELERAASLDRTSARTGMLLVMTHLRAKAPDKALAVVLDMEKAGDNPLIQNLKGGVFLAKQDRAAARSCFNQALTHDPVYMPALANLAQLDAADNKPDDARMRYEAALAKSPANVAVMEALSRLALGQGRNAVAVKWLERAQSVDPDALAPALRLAELYGRDGQHSKALVLAQKLQAAHPASAEALALLAQSHYQNRNLDAAADSYTRLAVLTPRSPLPQMRLATLHLTRRDDAAALAALHKALSIDPDLLDAQLTMLNVLIRQKQFAEAYALAAGARKRLPASPAGYKLEGDVLSAQNKHGAALEAYEKAFALKPGGPLLIQIHGALNKLGRKADADQRMLQWFKEHGNDVPTRLYYASSKLVGNDPGTAIAQFEAVLKVEPNHIIALNDLAWVCQQSGDARASAFAERALALAPNSPAVMDTLGWIYLGKGDLARALPLLRKASALAPDANEIRFHLGTVLARSGDKRAARRELEKLLASPQQFAHREQAKALLASL